MPAGSCPECSNLVALSANRCPQCGNRDFLKRTKDFFEICNSCNGAGETYTVKNDKAVGTKCESCKGKGYYSKYYSIDVRDSSDVQHYFNERRRLENNAEVKSEALSEETIRNAKFSAEADYRIKKSIRDDDLRKEEKARLEKSRRQANERFKLRISFAFQGAFFIYVIIGLGGCIVREQRAWKIPDYYGVGKDGNGFAYGMAAWTNEALLVSIAFLVIVLLIAFINKSNVE